MNVSNQFSNPSQFKDQIVQFIVEHKVIGSVVGVGIALASKDLIQSMVGDVVFPAIYYMLLRMHGKYFTKILPDNTKFDMPSFIKHLITWIFVIIITYFFITIVFKMLLGVNNPSPDKKKEDKQEDINEENIQEATREGFLALSPTVLASSFEPIISNDKQKYQAHEDPLHGSPVMSLEEHARMRLQNM
jgi:large-conductance mechanosensitive channel